MNILYYAVFSNEGWGAENFINEGFKALGHETYCIDYRKNRDTIHEEHLKAVSLNKFDLFFLQRGDEFPIDIIKSMGCKKVFWASELVNRTRDQDRLLQCSLFDHTFFHSSDCIKLARADVNKSSVLLNGFSEDIYKPLDTDKTIDILFSGLLTPRRYEILNNTSKYFKITVSTKFGEYLNEEFNRSKIILNIHAEDHLDMETRVFEVLGSNSFLLSEQLNSDNPFTNNYHLAMFGGERELFWRLDYYLNNDKHRDEIRNDGHTNAVKNHTYKIRAKEILERII